MAKVFEGLKVVDLTAALNGPMCTMFLADYGAEVIKVEPLHGDQGRSFGPVDEETGESGFFANYNRNKKSVTLNLKSEKGIEMLMNLIKDADVLVENYKGGVTKRLGIDYETVKKINPTIIYASGSGFGQGTSLSHRPAYDIVAQAMGGILNATGFKDAPPVKVGPSVADHVTGIYLAVGVMMALYHRERTGEGQWVDVAMFDTIFSIQENAIPLYFQKGEVFERNGNIDPTIAPFDVYECTDGYVAMGCGTDKHFKILCDLIGRPDLLEKDIYNTNDNRTINYLPELQEIVSEFTKKHTKAEMEAMMDEAGLPCGIVNNIKEAIEHPLTAEREMIVHCEHPVLGDLPVQGCVVKMSETPGSVRTPAPLLGQHNREIWGLTEEEEKQLKEEGVI